MDPNKQLKSTLKYLLHFLELWGIDKENLSVDNSNSPHFKRSTISGQKDGLSFRAIVYAKIVTVDEPMNKFGMMHPSNSVALYGWDMRFIFFIKNPHQLEMKLSLEDFGHKVKKFFGNNDLEVYEDVFDNTFKVECSNNYAHIDILTAELQKKMLSQTSGFTEYLAQNGQVRYKQSFQPHLFRYQKKATLQLLDIGLLLAKNIQNWSPPPKK